MQFNSHSTGDDLISDITFLTGADLTNDYLINDRTRNINRWNDIVLSDILGVDGRWQYDDPNHVGLAMAVTTVAENIQDYTVMKPTPEANQDWLRFTRAEIKDSDGNWTVLEPIDETKIEKGYLEFEEDAGIPKYIDVRGPVARIFPKPNYTQTASLKMFFQRNASYFAPTDETKRPGFASIYHRILSMGASYDWFKARVPEKAEVMMRDISMMREECKTFYSTINKQEDSKLEVQEEDLY